MECAWILYPHDCLCVCRIPLMCCTCSQPVGKRQGHKVTEEQNKTVYGSLCEAVSGRSICNYGGPRSMSSILFHLTRPNDLSRTHMHAHDVQDAAQSNWWRKNKNCIMAFAYCLDPHPFSSTWRFNQRLDLRFRRKSKRQYNYFDGEKLTFFQNTRIGPFDQRWRKNITINLEFLLFICFGSSWHFPHGKKKYRVRMNIIYIYVVYLRWLSLNNHIVWHFSAKYIPVIHSFVCANWSPSSEKTPEKVVERWYNHIIVLHDVYDWASMCACFIYTKKISIYIRRRIKIFRYPFM